MRRTGAICRIPPSNPAPILLKSGRMSAEPPAAVIPEVSDYRLSTALNALDLDNFDFRNIDPVLASQLLEEIRNGADIAPLLERLRSQQQQRNLSKAEKMVTFEDDIKPVNKLNADDVFM